MPEPKSFAERLLLRMAADASLLPPDHEPVFVSGWKPYGQCRIECRDPETGRLYVIAVQPVHDRDPGET